MLDKTEQSDRTPNPNEKPESCYCSALAKGSGLCLPCYTRWLAGARKQLDQVEGIEEDVLVDALVTHEIERGHAVVIASDSLAIDDAGARAQACQRLDDHREAAGEIVARTAVKPHLRASLAGNDAKAVVFDLMQPFAA